MIIFALKSNGYDYDNMQVRIMILAHSHRHTVTPSVGNCLSRMIKLATTSPLEAYLRHLLADEEFSESACEWVVILFLLRTFCRPTALTDIFKFYGTVSKWADQTAQFVGRIDGNEVVVNVLENPPSYPLIGVVYYGNTIK